MPSFNNPKVTNPINSDVSETRELLKIVAKQDYTGATDLPEGAKRLAIVSGGVQLQKYANSSWSNIGKLMHDVDTLDGYHASTSAVKNTIPVYNAAAQLVGSITGNAATATKLASARTIDIGGIASADAVAFDGTKGITIPINSINVANEADNALVGIVSKAHGGTGRNDGAAADVIFAGSKKASAYGQIGNAASATGKHLDTLTTDGNYISVGISVSNGWPYDMSRAVCVVRVSSNGTTIHQTLYCSGESVWQRYSTNSGASWSKLVPISTRGSGLALYISKSGNDNNTGMDSAHPVLTINRALQIANGWKPSYIGGYVKFCIGEGDWGDVTFTGLPFQLKITPYDGATPTAYSESLPKFGTLSSYHSDVNVYGVDANILDANGKGFLSINGYNRFGTLRARYGGINYPVASTSGFEIKSIDSHEVVFDSYNAGTIIMNGTTKFKVIENLTLSRGFVRAFYTNFHRLDSASITLNSGVKVTGKKYVLGERLSVDASKVFLDSLPGSSAGTITDGCIIGGLPYGGGAADEALMADLSWKPVLLQTGGEASNNLSVRKSNSPSYGLINDGFTLGTDPGSNRYWSLVFYDKNKKALGDVFCFHNADVYDGSSAIEFRLISDDGEEFDSAPKLGLVRTKSSNKTYAIAPTPLDSADGNEIVTAAWANKNIISKLSSYLPLSGGTVTGSISVTANPLIQSTPWSGISIADSTRSKSAQKIIGQVLDKNSKRLISLEVGAGTDGSRSLNINGRNRADTGWTQIFQVTEKADNSIVGTLGSKNIVRSVNGANADVNGNVVLDISSVKVDNAVHADSATTATTATSATSASSAQTCTGYYVAYHKASIKLPSNGKWAYYVDTGTSPKAGTANGGTTIFVSSDGEYGTCIAFRIA